MSNDGWIGFDLDGTTAHYDGWVDEEHIGEPVPAIVALIKKLRAEGEDVRIFTARVAHGSEIAIRAIQRWCLKHIGEVLPITNVKDFKMIRLYDDRAVQVEFNTGRIIQ